MPVTPPLVEMQGVGFRQQGVDILRDITWGIAPGEHWAILGPNGSGKTSLLRVAAGYRWHTSGVVRRLGEELPDLATLRRRFGWVSSEVFAYAPPQEPTVSFVVSGRFGQMGLRAKGPLQASDADFDDARRLLDTMGAGALADKPLRVLSQGERQKALVARARMTDPVWLVLDEPCAGMDPAARERFLAWLGAVMADAATPAVAMITHHIEEVLPQFEHAALLSEGRLVAAGPTAPTLGEASLEETYGVGLVRLTEHRGRRWPIWGEP